MKRHPVLAFVILSFVLSWSFWVPLVLGLQGRMRFVMEPYKYQMWGAYGPFFAAVIVAAANGGLEQFRKMLSRFFIWRVSVIWYVVALLLPAVIGLLITGIHMILGGHAPEYGWPPIYQRVLPGILGKYDAWTILVPYFFYHLATSTAIAEEFGWRGFVLPKLQSRYSALASSVFIGLVWGLWMWPVYLTQGNGPGVIPYYIGLLGVIPAAIVSTWLFNNAAGSLLILVLFNNAAKVTDLFLAMPPAHPLIAPLAYWIVAVPLVIWFRPRTLTGKPLPPRCREPIFEGDPSIPGLAAVMVSDKEFKAP